MIKLSWIIIQCETACILVIQLQTTHIRNLRLLPFRSMHIAGGLNPTHFKICSLTTPSMQRYFFHLIINQEQSERSILEIWHFIFDLVFKLRISWAIFILNYGKTRTFLFKIKYLFKIKIFTNFIQNTVIDTWILIFHLYKNKNMKTWTWKI